MNKVTTKIDEFVQMSEPKPTTAPPKTTPSPSTTPSRPSPIRRDKPAVEPKPQAKVEDTVNRFMAELKKVSKPFNLDLKKLKQVYGNY
jgi:hypothetical protein